MIIISYLALCSNRRSLLLAIILPFAFAFLFSINNTFGQETRPRPKIGLALSGGGACGLAHIGVLKVMEEEGLRPDYISGVSMGSIIGAFYSAGYTPDSIEKLISSLDLNLLLSNRISENKIVFTEKGHFYNSIVFFPIVLKKLKLPSGLINGQQIENFLSYSLWNVADVNDFSKLSIPFMCVATDLKTCTRIDLKTGYLPDAIRASSSVPYIFTPLKIDSMLLVDGGVLRNFAPLEVKNMGADIIIGSYTGSRYRSEDKLQSVTEVMTQLGFFPSMNDYTEQKKIVKYLIEPKTSDISAIAFEQYDTLIQRGYNAAVPFRKAFRALADSLNRYGKQEIRNIVMVPRTYVFDSIRIVGNKIFSAEQIKGVLDISPGEKVDRKMLADKIDLLYGKNWFEKVKYIIVPKNKALVLEIDCIEKPRATLYGSVHYDNALEAGLIVGLSIRDPLFRSSQLEINSQIAQLYKFSFSYIKFIDRNQKYSLSGDIYADNTYLQKLKLNNLSVPAYSRSFNLGVALNRRLGLNNMLRLSSQIENPSFVRDQVNGNGREKFRNNYGSAELSYRSNTLNTKYFPNRGVKTEVSVKASKLLLSKYQTDTIYVLYDNSDSHADASKMFYTFHASFDQYFSKHKKWTLDIGGEFLYITSSDSLSEKNNYYFLGGFESVNPRTIQAIGFHPFQVPVSRMGEVHLDLDYEIMEKVHLTLMTGITAMQEKGVTQLSILPGIGLGAGYMSIIGPVKAGVMYGVYKNEDYFKRLKGYISVGFNF